MGGVGLETSAGPGDQGGNVGLHPEDSRTFEGVLSSGVIYRWLRTGFSGFVIRCQNPVFVLLLSTSQLHGRNPLAMLFTNFFMSPLHK